jgi:DNA invertase Pin-like site-specific DNA recombinase
MPQPQPAAFDSPFEFPSPRRRSRRHQSVREDLVVGYIRASKDRQRLTPAVQEAALKFWCEENGKTLVAVFTDRDVSGDSTVVQRPGLLKALAALQEHHAGTLLVAVRDRIARSVQVASQVDAFVRAEGAALRCADGVGNAEGPDGDLQRGISDVFAAHELSKIRWRTRQALALKRSRGERTGSVPWGFRLDRDDVHLVVDPDEQVIVRLVRRLNRRGWSLRSITAELERRGFRNRSGSTRWWPASIQSMLCSYSNR